MKTYLASTTLALLAWGCVGSPPAQRSEQPNIILFVIDDLGWADLGCYGSTFHETPYIDALARGGMRFSDAYATSPVCSPSRASIHSGKYPARLGVTDWIPGVRYPFAALETPRFTQELGHAQVTLAEALRAGGYTTWHVGKWHLGGEAYYPLEQGFDVNIGGHSKGAPGSYFHPYEKVTETTDWTVRNLPPGGEPGDYLTDRLTDEALELLRSEPQAPFFLNFSYYAVHTPIEGKPELVEKFKGKRVRGPEPRQSNATYAAMIQSVDESVGRILAELDDLGIADNTIIVLTSDNGGVHTHGITTNNPLRKGKGHLYEGGIREPLIVRWPGRTRPGSLSKEPITGADLYPTLLSVAGLQGDAQHNADVDGRNLVPLLLDPLSELERDLFWHYPHYHTPTRPPAGAIRSGGFKLIEFFEDGRLELYDLSRDIGETTNLAAEEPELVAALRERLAAWRTQVAAQMPRPNFSHDEEQPFRGSYADWGAVTDNR